MPLRLALAALLAASALARAEEPAAPVESHLVPHTCAELGFRDFQGVLHSHSYLSHDSKISQADIVAACEEAGVEFLCMTDHPSERSLSDGLEGWHGRTFFVVGAEVNHFLAVDIHTPIGNADSQQTVDRVRAQGGLAFVAHSEEYTDWDVQGYHGMEIYNIHTDLKDEKKLERLLPKLPRILEDPAWAMTLIFDEPKDLLARWDQLTQQRRVVGIAGNDAHQNVMVMGLQLDPYARSLGFVNTHVFALAMSKETLLDALSSGHVYVCFERFAPGKGFSFTAESGDAIAMMGDEVPYSGDLVLRAVFPREARITLVRDGKPIHRVSGDEINWSVTEPGVYRIAARVEARGRWWPWIYSNPIYVR